MDRPASKYCPPLNLDDHVWLKILALALQDDWNSYCSLYQVDKRLARLTRELTGGFPQASSYAKPQLDPKAPFKVPLSTFAKWKPFAHVITKPPSQGLFNRIAMPLKEFRPLDNTVCLEAIYLERPCEVSIRANDLFATLQPNSSGIVWLGMLPIKFCLFSKITFSAPCNATIVVHQMWASPSFVLDYNLYEGGACYAVQMGDKQAFIHHGTLLLPVHNITWAIPKPTPWLSRLMSLINPLWSTNIHI